MVSMSTSEFNRQKSSGFNHRVPLESLMVWYDFDQVVKNRVHRMHPS